MIHGKHISRRSSRMTKAHVPTIGSEPVRLQSERLEESSIVMKQNYFEFSVSVSNDINFDRAGRELESG